MDAKGFKDLEDFEMAYKSRFDEYIKLNKLDDIPKILIMHWGGVIIELYIKHIIVKNSGANKSHGKFWYTKKDFNFIISQGNDCKKGVYKDYACVENPKHDIEKAIKSIDFFNNLITDNKEMINHIKLIADPLSKGAQFGFIDLRYVSNINGIDELFNKWNESFKTLLQWLIKHSKNIEVKLDE